MYRFVDMHCHLDLMANGPQVAADARGRGIALLNASVTPQGYRCARERYADAPAVRCAAGLHPWWVSDGSCGDDDAARLALDLASELDSLDDAISTLTYMDQIQESNNRDIQELNDAEAELEQKKAELEEARKQAEDAEQKAADTLAEAQRLRSEAQARAEQEAAEELARLAADTSAASGEGADGGNASNTANQSGQSASVTVDGSVNWNVTRDEFISTWTARIDAYLSGSPLAGYGRVFAEAAWDNSVDPRWSPAIACIESTKGTYCFRDYNAWGWMTSTRFSSWEESITAHVAFLGNVYGPTLTPAAAQKYCPPTWQDWYNKVGGQMNLI